MFDGFGTAFVIIVSENRKDRMKKIFLTSFLAMGLAGGAFAQDRKWTVEECMLFAIENSPAVKIQQHSYKTNKAEYTQAVTSFLPSVYIDVGVNYGFGRSVDDNYNYTNTTNFTNSYGASVSLPLFSGGQLVNSWLLSKINLKLGKNNVQKEKDELAIRVMAAFTDVIYYREIVQYATEKLDESRQTLHQAQRKEELGLKGKADVIQIESLVAEDDYRQTNYINLYNKALLTLKSLMNYPLEREFEVEANLAGQAYSPQTESIMDIYNYALGTNPAVLKSEYQLESYKKKYLIEKGRLLPSISFRAGVNTNYYKDLKSENRGISFAEQFKNKRNEYVGFSLSFPLFNGLSRVTNVKRANNNLRIAYEQQVETQRQLQTAIEQAVLDREGFAKEAIQMDKKVKADTYSYQVTLRKYEEGLLSSLDLQTSSNILIQSKANLALKKLMYMLKAKEVDYYKGIPLVSEDIK